MKKEREINRKKVAWRATKSLECLLWGYTELDSHPKKSVRFKLATLRLACTTYPFGIGSFLLHAEGLTSCPVEDRQILFSAIPFYAYLPER